MKTLLFFLQIFLLMCGVFGADEVKTVSVMEGESVTLNLDFTQIQGVNEILWRFGGSTIAKKDGNDISYEDVKGFKGRLQLDQTGSLTITNVRINHSGLYKAEIRHNRGTSYQNFSLTVYESQSVIAQTEAELKSESVTAGDPVTLHVPQIQGDELIVWRFGDEGKLIAKADLETKSSSLYDETDERFRDRLKLDQTGSLTITNTRTTDSGEYKVKISSNKPTLYKRFTVTVIPGLSGAAVALIVIGVLLLLLAVAVAGVMYYRRPITTKLPNQTWLVLPFDNITLNPETEIQRGDEIQWLFGAGETLIAEIKGKNREMKTYKGPDERFRDRLKQGILKLDETPGSLTIKNILTKHTGLFTLKIRRGRETFYKRFNVSVGERKRPVMEGDDVPLNSDNFIQKGDEIQWLFDDKEQTVLTEIKNTKVTKYTGPDWKFRDRLELDEEKGELTITNITAAHEGFYTLKITRGRDKIYKRFYISVSERKITETEGYPATLEPAYEIKKDDLIRWLFGDEEQQTGIAEFNVKTGKILTYDDVADGIFRDRLELDKTTGSLTITNTTTQHAGRYHLEIISSSEVTEQIFTVTVEDKVSWKFLEEDFVTLTPDTVIQRDDQILWMFGYQDKLIAQMKGGTVEIYDDDDVNKRFRDRLKLDKTGSLTIRKIEDKHTGRYKLLIISSSRGTLCNKFKVSIKARNEEVTVGDSVHLKTDLTEIQRDEEIEWRFGDKNSLIAEIKGGTVETHDGPDEIFRDRLELNKKTGDLTIKNSSDDHYGRYKLNIRNSEGNKNRTYFVNIRARFVTVTEGESVRLNTDLTEIQRDDEIEWRFGNTLIAEIKGGTVETHDGPDERFRDRLELNKKTGDLTIKNSRDKHAGLYKLKIRSSKGDTNRTYIVTITARFVTVTEGESVRLNTDLTEIQRDEEIEWRFGDENSLIAEIKGGTVETRDGPDERFRDRLELNKKTGDLIIKNSTDEHDGCYKLKIRSSKGNTYRTYIVFITARIVVVTAGESVRLNTDLTEIQRDEGIEWMFGDKKSLIAEIKGGTVETHDVPDKRFRDRLQLNKKTGDLIIKNSRTEHTGPYRLKISSSKGNTYRTYSVIIRARNVVVTAGESVRLNTDLTEIQRDDEIEWRFGYENSLIAEIKGGTVETRDGPDEIFRDRLELNKKTGDLIIKNSTDEHDGHYRLKISSSKGNTYRTYIVTIREARTESLIKEKTDSRRNRVNESVTVEMEKKPLLNRDDLNVVNEEERTSSL